MQTESSASGFWIVGRTRREKVVAGLGILSFCGAILWALINGLSYGSEGVAPARLNTNGLFPTDVVLVVFFALGGASVLCVLLFWLFRFLDGDRNDVA